MKVFGIGLSRTGTTKLAYILDQLGFNTLDFVTPLFDRDKEGKPVPRDWSVLERRNAFTDSPIPLLYPELDRRSPGAKFILTTRDLDSWLASMHWMLTEGRIIWNYGPQIDHYHREIYGTSKFNEKTLSAGWHAFHSDVHDYFRDREHDLLVVELAKGFDVTRLTSFLGVEPRQVDVDSIVNGRRSAPLKSRVRYWARTAVRLKNS